MRSVERATNENEWACGASKQEIRAGSDLCGDFRIALARRLSRLPVPAIIQPTRRRFAPRASDARHANGMGRLVSEFGRNSR
jgi:hypothetical protein